MKRKITMAGKAVAFRHTLLSVAMAGCFGAGVALAQPVGPQVINGSVNFSTQGNVLNITNTPNAIINWQGFSIAPNEVTRFIQQGAGSNVLNRVVGQESSAILGALQSNGRVYLINPNGILFGPNARVDVNGLIASTLDIGNQDFLAGKYSFKAGAVAGKLDNQGAIATPGGGRIVLIAPDVQNSGILTSPQGEILLAAGKSVQLVDTANPDMAVVVSAPQDQALNLGQIVGQGGKVGIYGALVNQRGKISADSAVVGENGKIIFKASRDALLEAGSVTSATGAGKGGEIQVLGERVGLTGDARVDVSGQMGGGTVLVGGDYQGKNPAVLNAQVTYAGQDVQIKADAIQSGDGGKVIVWADDTTRAYGKIYARGGQQGGNGGFVETSGKRYLDVLHAPDNSATRGKGGTWLLDPEDITISAGGDANITAGPTFQPATAGSSTLNASTLTNYLVNTGDVTVDTTCASACGTNGGSITVSAPIAPVLTADRTLTLKADKGITIDAGAGIDATGGSNKLHVTLLADQNNSGSGAISLNDVIKTKGGNINITAYDAVTLVANKPVDSDGGQVNITVNNSASGINMPASSSIVSSGGAITLKADNMSFTSSSINAGSGDVKLTPNNGELAIELGVGATDVAGAKLGLTDGELKTITTSGMLTVGATTNSGAMTFAGTLDLTSGAGLTGPLTLEAGTLDFTVSSAISAPAGLNISTGGTLINSAAIAASGNVSLKADKMNLAGGTINAGNGAGMAMLKTYTPGAAVAIDLGAGAGDATVGTLELSNAELSTISAGTLRIGDASSGAIDIKSPLTKDVGGALEHVSGVLSLTSGGAVTQQANATIGVLPGLSVRGSSVALTQANPVGVIAGSASSGDFIYHSSNKVTVSPVDGVNGISVPTTGQNVKLESDSSEGVNQQTGCIINANGGGLVLKTIGPVYLPEANNVGTVAADLSLGGTGGGNLFLRSTTNLTVGSLLSVTGVTTNNKEVSLSTASGMAGNSLTIANSISTGAGANKVTLEADSLVLNDTVTTGGEVEIRPYTAGRNITVGSATCNAAPCLNVTNLYRISAPTVVIGSDYSGKESGAIYVARIAGPLEDEAAEKIRNSNTTRIGLLTGGGVTQGGAINVQDLGVSAGDVVNLNHAANSVTNLAGKTSADNFTFVNSAALNVIAMSGGAAPYGYSMTGISTGGGNVSLTASALNIPAQINAGAGSANLTASAGSVYGSGTSPDITAGVLDVTASVNVDGENGLRTQVSRINSLTATGGYVSVRNYGALVVGPATATPATTSVTAGSYVSLATFSPITINGALSAPGAISVTSSNGDALTISAPIASTGGGAVTLTASGGGTLAINQAVTTSGTMSLAGGSLGGSLGATYSSSWSNNTPAAGGGGGALPPPPPPPPTLDQCVANPSASGCTAVLPTLNACTANPAAAGCSVVLPTLNDCTANPGATGCAAVLPTLSQCTSNPSAAGCSVVLPPLSACTANPGATGCAAVLPTLSQCTSNPSAAGCSVVLPPLSACTANPGATGCAAVLPTLGQCTSNPSAAGCSVVLPTLNDCTVNPGATGCAAVLPTLGQCTSNPSAAGCSVVLPPLSACTANPSAAGCSVVLPSKLPDVVKDVGKKDEGKTLDQALNQTNNTLNNTALTSVVKPLTTTALLSPAKETPAPGSGASGEAPGRVAGSEKQETKAADEKKEEKKDDKKKDTTAQKEEKKDEAPKKKQYCN